MMRAELGVAALERAHVDQLLDQLGRARADDVPAEQLAVRALADELHHAGAVAVDDPAADRAVGHLADDHVVALLARLRLGQAERADVGRAEGGARDVHVGDRVRRQPGDVLRGDDALVGGLVRERGAGTRSPIAYTPARVVRIAPSTLTRPRSSSSTPASASPSPSTSAPRPAQITR